MENELIKELARKPHFVAYHGIPVRDKTGEARTSKVPMYGVKTSTGRWKIHQAKTDTPTTWGTYEQAREWEQAIRLGGKTLKRKDGREVKESRGIGFVLTLEDGIGGIDLDHCYDSPNRKFKDTEAGKAAARVMEILTRKSSGTYAEVSPSGDGLHIWGRFNLPPEKEKGLKVKNQQIEIEMYRAGRFMTVTGNTYHHAGVNGIQAAVDEIIKEFHLMGKAPARQHTQGTAAGAAPTLSDRALIEKIRTSKQSAKFRSLFDDGNIEPYENDQSQADIALMDMLAFYTRDPEQLKRLFLLSALGQNVSRKPKPDYYLNLTIEKALNNVTNGYNPKEYAAQKQAEEQEKAAKNGDVSGGEEAPVWPYIRTVKRDGKMVSIPYPHTENLRYFLEDVLHVTVRLNTVSKKVEFSGDGAKQFANSDSDPDPDFYGQRVKDKLQECDIKGYTLREVLNELNAIAAMNQYSPVCDYLEECYKAYDGKDYMKELFSMLELAPDVEQDPEFLYLLFQKWFVSAVQIAFNTMKNLYTTEGVLVFIGNPGIGKTRFFGEMLLKDHPEWLGVGQKFNPNNKDNALDLWSFWIYELADYNESGNKEVQNDFKRYIDRPYDSIRPPYAVGAKKWPRTTIMFGTSNESNFLHDETGNRRYWPIALKAIHMKKDFNARQLWGQAMNLWKDGTVKPYLEEKSGDYDRLQSLNIEHSRKSDTQMVIEDNYDWDRPVKEWNWKKPIKIAQELNGYLNPYDKYSPTNVGAALTLMGSNDKRIKFTKRKGYYVPPLKSQGSAGNTQDGKQV